jgi:hypothetical protein
MDAEARMNEPETIRRLGLDWCVEHNQASAFCCADKKTPAPANRPGGYPAVRKYLSLMIKGKTHPFTQAGGHLTGAVEGVDAAVRAMREAPIQRIPLTSLIATSDVQPTHIRLVLNGKAPSPRMGNHVFESSDVPTVIRAGQYHVIADGHHRLAAEWAKGNTHAKCRVLTGLTPTFNNSADLLVRPL